MLNRFKHPLRILTWHIHGSYLYYLVQSKHEFFLPVKADKPDGYVGITESYPWPENVHEVGAEEVRNIDFDCIIFQSPKNFLEDQFEILSEAQRQLPRIFLQHDPPREHPTDTRHPVIDPDVLIVHVTHFNNLMWDNGDAPTQVIDHGVLIPPGIKYTGEIEKGLVVVNNMLKRGRRLGLDVFESVRRQIPLDLVGINSLDLNGIGSFPHRELLELESHYRFIFNPIRYTSLGLSICEAMMIGAPIIGLATTEMVTAIENGVSGYVDTNVSNLVTHMRRLLADPAEARRLGAGAQLQAQKRFNIKRFIADWDEALASITGMAVEHLGNRPQEVIYEENYSDD